MQQHEDTDGRRSRAVRTRAGGSRSFEIFPAKLQVPPLQPGLVERAGLLKYLERASSGRYVSVVAPPGYGKTTALGQWAARDGRRFAWVSLDHRDNDPVLLLTYIAAALNADGSVAPAVFKRLKAAGGSLWATGLPRLGEALASQREPVVLVLDDIHELENDDCLDALLALVPHVPRGSHLVFSGRAEARLGLAKLRADGELLEVGVSALALTDAEAGALLNASGVAATDTEVRALNEHTEGWAAGLYLATLSLESSSSSLASFGGDDRFITDYLRAEELAHVGPAELEFLLRTSVLDRMSGPLCDAVLERHASIQLLEQLDRSNLFVIPLDHQRCWFRYHHLFKEMLRAELERREPDLVATLNRRAASWCEANGETESAIEYLAASGDTDELARLVWASAGQYFRSSRVTTVERWLELFDDPALLERYPAITVLGACVHASRGRPDAADRWALAVEANPFEGAMPDGSPFEAWAATLRALLCKHGVEQMGIDAELAVSLLSAASPWRATALLLRAVAVQLSGAFDRADEMLDQAAEAAGAGGEVWVGAVACSERALLALDRGDLPAAEWELARAEALIEHAPSAEYVVTAVALAVTARLENTKGQRARARRTLAGAQRLRPLLTHALPWLAVQSRLELAKAHLDLSDPGGASTLYQEAAGILRRRPRLGTLVDDAERVRARIPTIAQASSGWPSTLTAAELRLLPLLTTHLSFREIAERLFVSRNTVKTQAISIYRKLDASSRSEAIERAIELGLVDAQPASLAV